MDEDRRNLMGRIEILRAYSKALQDPEKLIRVCLDVSGDDVEERSAIAAAFEVADFAADAILAMQVRLFTPRRSEEIRRELADANRLLLDLDRS
ncbi:hypothetical protein [Microbacterium sp. P05]|uniref:hypothetical protein n=1 Tax=Microbacterium sp. P05 TaxID=3366948 RepID=UPI003746534F